MESVEEGYDLKGEQVAMALQPLGLENLAVGFFNAHGDDPARLCRFLLGRVNAIRDSFRKRIVEITENAHALLLNHEQAQAQEVTAHAATMLRTWTTQSSGLRKFRAHIQDSLMEELTRIYASSIRASVRREGEWYSLSYSHHLGYGARRIARLALGKTVEGFSELCKTMRANPEYTEAQDLINQAERNLISAYEELLRKVQLMGQTSFRDELKIDAAFWLQCDNEWGQGPGYRNRVTTHNTNWFNAEPRLELETELHTLIQREWSIALANLTSLFEEQ